PPLYVSWTPAAGSGYRFQRAVQPPSTKTELPVMNDDASELSNTTTPASSSTSPQRPSGMLRTNSWYFTGSLSRVRFISVPKGPGQIALTVTPVPAHSRARARVRLATPALAEAYGARPGIPITDRIEPRLMMRPQPRLT